MTESLHARKWTAFFLSLAAPGAGQLWIGSAWCLPWWLGLVLAAVAWQGADPAQHRGGTFAAQAVCFLGLALASAEHAKRVAEHDRSSLPARDASYKVHLGPRSGRRIETRIEMEIPAPASEVWRRVADLPRFLTIDPFHERVTLMRAEPAPGVDVVLWHNAFGRRFPRFGRILQWREGCGYAFSDLSPRGPHAGFPHVFFVEVEPATRGRVSPRLGEERVSERCDHVRTHLTVTVRGKWSSRWIPVAVGRWWVYYVACEHARLLRKAMATQMLEQRLAFHSTVTVSRSRHSSRVRP